jgi:predicted Zn finger-like uncharacterized protein
MLIVCPSCSSRYNIDDAKIGAEGRKVRCASCATQWHVSLPAAPESAPDLSPASVAALAAAPAAPPPEADPFDEEAMAREWAAAEAFVDETAATGGLTAEKIRAIDAADRLPDVAAGALPDDETGQPSHAASAAALGAAAAAAVKVPWWRRLFRRAPKAPAGAAARQAPAAKAAPPSAARRKGRPATARKPLRLPALAKGPLAAGVAGFTLLAGLYWQREALVRLAPASAPAFALAGAPVNLSGLVFTDIRSTVHAENGGRFLVVEGVIRSEAPDVVPVPLIELSLRGEDRRAVYTWTTDPPRRSLKPGESLHFRTRLATPPEAARDVEVRFTDKARNAAARH